MIVILYLWIGSDTSIILFHAVLCTHLLSFTPEDDHMFGRNT